MAEKKMTKAIAFATAADLLAAINPEVAEIVAKEAERLGNRKPANRKPTKKQEANVGIMEDIMGVLRDGGRYTATDIANVLELSSGQKASALLKKMVDDGVVVRISEKNKSYFALPEEVAAE